MRMTVLHDRVRAWMGIAVVEVSQWLHATPTPRKWSRAPIGGYARWGTNFVLGSFQHAWGDVALDSSLPISNVKAVVDSGVLGYEPHLGPVRTAAAAAVLLPYVRGDLSGDVDGQGKQITREGQGDMGFRLWRNLMGGPGPDAGRIRTTLAGNHHSA